MFSCQNGHSPIDKDSSVIAPYCWSKMQEPPWHQITHADKDGRVANRMRATSMSQWKQAVSSNFRTHDCSWFKTWKEVIDWWANCLCTIKGWTENDNDKNGCLIDWKELWLDSPSSKGHTTNWAYQQGHTCAWASRCQPSILWSLVFKKTWDASPMTSHQKVLQCRSKTMMQNYTIYYRRSYPSTLHFSGSLILLMEWIPTVLKHSTTSWLGLPQKQSVLQSRLLWNCVYLCVGVTLLGFLACFRHLYKNLTLCCLQTPWIVWMSSIDLEQKTWACQKEKRKEKEE